MCQAGARAQAEAGRTASQILGGYFPGTTLTRAASGAWYDHRPEGAAR
jgi:peptidoglycan hydrolase-like amidase